MAGIGDALRSTRERRGLSIDQVAQDTRISPRFLEALEAEQFDELPAPVYVRGFIRSYANYLKIEPQPLLDRLVGGDFATPGVSGGYVGGQRGGSAPQRDGNRRTDPFQRRGVVPAPPLTAPVLPRTPVDDDEESWAPEPTGPLTPPPAEHGYIPGSDLMEAPEYTEYEPEPAYRPRPVGVLVERPPAPGEPGIPRRVALFAVGVLAVLAFLLVAVIATRGDGDGTEEAQANGGGGQTPVLTPGSVIPVGSRTATQAAGAGASATTSATASVTGTVTGTTTPGTATPTSAPGTAAATATQTPTPSATQAPPTAVPTATPTLAPPTPTPTRVPTVVAANLGLGECQATGTGSYDCGPPPYRIICFTPIGFPLNRNWWIDVNWDFGSIPADWREATSDGIGGAITAGGDGCD